MKSKNWILLTCLLSWGGLLFAQPSVGPEARFKGAFGARFSVGAGTVVVADGSPDNEDTYRARFYLSANDLDLAGTNLFSLFSGRNGATTHFEVLVHANGTGHNLSVRARLDSGSTVTSPQIPVNRGWQAVEVRWRSGSGDGELSLVKEGNVVATLENLDNDQALITSVVLGYDAPSGAGDTGSFDIDDFDSRKLSDPGLECLSNQEFLSFLADWPTRDLLEEMDLLAKRCPE